MSDDTPQHPRPHPSTESKPPEDGFELNGEFIRWHVSDGAKDLILVDRFAGMPITEFFQLIEDSFDRGRAPVLLALMATSLRNKHPDWSVDRLERTVMNLSLSDVTFIDADVEEESLPPTPEDETDSTQPASSDSSSEPKSSASETAPETSETSSETLE